MVGGGIRRTPSESVQGCATMLSLPSEVGRDTFLTDSVGRLCPEMRKENSFQTEMVQCASQSVQCTCPTPSKSLERALQRPWSAPDTPWTRSEAAPGPGGSRDWSPARLDRNGLPDP